MAWLTGWTYRKQITVQADQVDANLEDFPLYVKINADADFHEALSTGYDIRFTQSDGETLLKYERESWSGGNGSAATADFWVKVPTIDADDGAVIYIYYGKADAVDGADPANVWDSNFVGVWHMNQASWDGTPGEVVSSTGAHSGTAAGGATTTASGKVGYAGAFDGSNDRVDVSDHVDLDGMDAWTFEGWLYRTGGDTYARIADKGVYIPYVTSYEGLAFALSITTSGTGGGTSDFFDANAFGQWITDSTWTHFAYTWSAVEAACECYKNSVKGTTQARDGDTISAGEQALYFADRADSERSFGGYLDELRLSKSRRTAEWIKFEYYNMASTDQELTWSAEAPSSSPSASISATPSSTPSASISASPSPSATPSVSPSASLSASPSPSATPSVSPSASLSASPSPSATPSVSPSASLSASPSISPSVSFSGTPSASISHSPSSTPSGSISASPSIAPGTQGNILGGFIADVAMTPCTRSLTDNYPLDMTIGTSAVTSTILEEGTSVSNLPLSMPALARTGVLIPTFRNDYYDRIHLVPREIDYGFLAGDTAEVYEVWNAFFVPKSGTFTTDDATNVLITDEDGVAVSTGTVFALGALAGRLFTVTAPLAGDLTFEVTHTWNFGASGTFTVIMTGVRAVLFPWKPLNEIKESLEWLTQIIASNDGTEQRICLRQIPREKFDWTIHLADAIEFSRLDAMLHKKMKLTMCVPIWSEQTVIESASLTEDDEEISFTTAYASYAANGMAVVWKSATECEIISIDSVEAGRLVLKSGLKAAYTGRVYVAPAFACYAVGTVGREDYSTTFQQSTVSWQLRDPIAVTGYSAALTHGGRPVLLDVYCIDDNQPETNDGLLTGLDFETGAFSLWSDATYNRNTRTFRFHNDTPAAAWEFRQLLHSLYGRQLTVYVPTWKADMALHATIGSSDTSFQIEDADLAAAFSADGLRNNVLIRRTDGTNYTRTVTGITSGVGYEVVAIDTALGTQLTVADCAGICWLDRYRLAEDSVALNWERAGVNTCDLPLAMVTA
jgi:hypothetical protein